MCLLWLTREKTEKRARDVGSKPMVIEHATGEVLASPQAADDEEAMEPTSPTVESVVLVCPSCGQANKVAASSTNGMTYRYRCAKCREMLPGLPPEL